MSQTKPWWRVGGWTNLKRFEFLTLASLYPLFCLPTLTIVVWTIESGRNQSPPPGMSGTVIAITAAFFATVAGCRFLHRAIHEKPLTAGHHILNAVVFPIAALTFLDATALNEALRWAALLLLLIQGIGLYATQFKGSLVSAAGFAVSVAVALVSYNQVHDQPTAIQMVIVGSVFVLIVAYGIRMSMWMIEVTRQLDRARITQAELAVAEERLRFSRDLHDVFGRTLSAVSVKSELAAALAQRHDNRAVTEMLEVRKIAATALDEVRAIVQGYRQISAPAEIAGAGQLLHSAGIAADFEFIDIQAWPDRVQELVAWFIREGVTNVVRHSRATTCQLHLEAHAQRYRVVMMNDGATHHPDDALTSRGGTGLKGLEERLARHGGHITWRHSVDDETFTLEMVVPENVAA